MTRLDFWIKKKKSMVFNQEHSRKLKNTQKPVAGKVIKQSKSSPTSLKQESEKEMKVKRTLGQRDYLRKNNNAAKLEM